MLPILTGNVGVPGGNSGDREGPFGIAFPGIPMGDDPVKTSIPCFMWTKAIDDPHNLTALNAGLLGKERLEVPIKFIWNFASNTLINQHSDINRTKNILSDETKCEMIVVIDNLMTASALFSDLLLPATSSFEENDLCYQSYGMELGALILREKAIEPLGECRPLFDICAQVAERMGVGANIHRRAHSRSLGGAHVSSVPQLRMGMRPVLTIPSSIVFMVRKVNWKQKNYRNG